MNKKSVMSNEMQEEKKRFDEFYQSLLIDNKLMYLGSLLQRAAHKIPDGTALLYKDESISYRMLYNYSVRLSLTLQKKGVQPGNRVLLFFENSIAFYVGYFGILQTGAVVVPLNTFLHEREVAHVVSDAQPSLIVASQQLAERLGKLNGISLPPIVTESELILEGDSSVTESFEIPKRDENEMAVLLYTSGTTGLPKGVMLSSKNALTNAVQVVSRFKYVGVERVFAVLPLFHSFAQNTCVWSPILMCCTIIVVPKIERRALLEGLEHKPTVFLGVPALFGLMALLKTAPLDSVNYFISGGDALPDKIRAAFALVYRRKICCGYGLTEASPVVSGGFDDVTESVSNVGRPLLGVACAIIDNEGKRLLPYQIGQLLVKGDNIMIGYYNNPERTKEVIKDGWLYTGDLAYIDKKGSLFITGRIKDLIIHKGLNIYPQEIENIILLHPNVLLVGVIGVDDEDVGQVPVAYVQLRHEEEFIEKALKELCAKNLAHYKIPKTFICSTKQLLTTATGKVDKKVLHKQVQ